MKKSLSQIFIVFAVCLLLLQSCSKNDSTPTDTPIVGGNAFRMQVVSIDLPNASLTASEYHGSIGTEAVTLTKVDDAKLQFLMPATAILGNQDLVINDLNNLKITYNVKDVVLPDTADAVITPFQNNLSTFQATPFGDASTLKAVNSFNQVYANATPAEKLKWLLYIMQTKPCLTI